MSASGRTNYARTAMYPERPSLGSDLRTTMMFEVSKKDVCIAYVLWFFVGYFGGHNFYLKRTGIAVLQLALTLTVVGVAINSFWLLAEAFLIPGWVRRENSLLAWTLGAAPFAR